MTFVIYLSILILASAIVLEPKIKPKWWMVYVLALGCLLPVTMSTEYLVGTDVHLEYYFAQRVIEQGWDISLPNPINSSMALTVIAPLFGSSLTFFFKVVVPALFCFVPAILFLIWKKYITEKEAFISAFFFVITPTFLMEISGIARQQAGEIFFVLFFFCLLSSLRWRFKFPLLVLSGLPVMLFHYSMNYVLLLYLVLYTTTILFGKLLRKTSLNPFYPALVILVLLGSSLLYYDNVAGGTPLRFLTALIPVKETKVDLPIGNITIGKIDNPDYILTGNNESPPYPIDTGPVVSPENALNSDPLLKTALGLDFFNVSLQGKLFRIFQVSILVFTMIGVIVVVWKKRPFPIEYLALAGTGGLTLVACLVVPGFSLILNPTRWYHIALFFLSPMAVLGWIRLYKSYKTFFLILIVPYFLLASGIVFELTQMTRIDKADTPYNVAFSDGRIDISGHFTKNDESIREWLKTSEIDFIYSDLYGLLFLQEELAFEKTLYFIPYNGIPPKGSYVFLREYSSLNNQITVWSGPGSRKVYPFNQEGELVWQVGSSKIIEV